MNSGYRHFFNINNSKQALNMLDNVTSPSSFDSYDFSNLYTNFRHDELMEKFGFLLDLLFANAEKKNSGDAIRTQQGRRGKARWVIVNEENRTKYHNQKFWTKCKILEAIEFFISNTHVKFGNFIFKQICGIPMGMIPAPGFAKLGLGVDEYRFTTKLIREKKIDVLRKLINMCRYIDDIGIANFDGFSEIAKDMYPRSLVLNKSNASGILNCAFLDLSVSVVENKFEVKVYNKTDDYQFRVITFPFLESNILTSICYSVYLGEILRYLRICSKLKDFESRARMLTRMLSERGYKQEEMAKQFFKVFSRYRGDAKKFPGGLVVTDLVQRVVFGLTSH